MYSSTISLFSALDENGLRHAPATSLSGKIRYPLYRRLSGSQGRCGRVWKIFPQTGFDPRTAQPVASRYSKFSLALSVSQSFRTAVAVYGSCSCLFYEVISLEWNLLLEHISRICKLSKFKR